MDVLTLATIVDSGDVVKVIAVGGGLILGMVAIIGGMMHSVAVARAKEATKREIAAYIAEGTMSSEDAERILTSDMPHWKKDRAC